MAAITGTIIVDSDKMKAQAAEVRKLANAVKNDFQAMQELMEKTRNYWIGEAGDLHRKLYDNQKDDIDNLIRRILEHPTDLEMMAFNYEAGESANVATISVLGEDVID